MSAFKFILKVILLTNLVLINAEETYHINGDVVNVVDERFLSISVDPALLYDFNSSLSMKMVQHLSPAFVRLAGPSTPLFRFSLDQTSGCCSITPWAWKAINFWIKDVNLTPVYLVNSSVLWDSNFLNLLEISSTMNFTSFWQMERDFETNIVQHKQDLLKLKSLIKTAAGETFLKTVGSNSPFLTERSPEMLVKTFAYLADAVDAVILDETLNGGVGKSKVPVWLHTPQKAPFLFSSAMDWVKQMEEAAKSGFKVIFKQLLEEELSSETPVYWISLLYKDLIGRGVLDVTFNSVSENGVDVFAHCSRKTPGAMTVLIINNDSSSTATSLKIANSFRTQQVQSYVMTFRFKDTFLNGQKLSLADFAHFKPEMSRLRYTNGYEIESGAKSVGFHTFPNVKVPACFKSEEKGALKNEELFEEFESRISFHKGTDEDAMSMKPSEVRMRVKKDDAMVKELLNADNLMMRTLPKNKLKGTTTLEIVFKERPSKNNTKVVELELTDQEIKKILKDRIENKLAERTSSVTGRRFEDILKEAARRALKTKRFAAFAQKLKQKRDAGKKTATNMEKATSEKANNAGKAKANHISKREKRDINMDLLRRKAEKLRRGEVKATMRRYEPPSEEVFMEGVEDDRNPDVYAGMFDSYREDLNCPQAKYVDERLEFLMEPSDVGDFLEREDEGYHTFHERFEKNSQPKTNDIKATLQKTPEEVKVYSFPEEWSSAKTSSFEPEMKTTYLAEEWSGKTPHGLHEEEWLKSPHELQMKSSFLTKDSEEAEDLPFDAVFAEEIGKLETTPIKLPKFSDEPSLKNFENIGSTLKLQEESMFPEKNQSNSSEINMKNINSTFMVSTNNVQEPSEPSETSEISAMHESSEDIPWYMDLTSDWSSMKQPEDAMTLPDDYFCDSEKSPKVKTKRDVSHSKLRDRLRTRRLKVPDEEIQGKLKRLRKRRLHKPIIRTRRSVDLYKNVLKKALLAGMKRENVGPVRLRTKKAPSYSVEVVDKQQFRQRTAPFVYHRLRDGKRYKRGVGLDSVENMIDDYNFVKVEEMAKYLQDLEEFNFNKKEGSTETTVVDTERDSTSIGEDFKDLQEFKFNKKEESTETTVIETESGSGNIDEDSMAAGTMEEVATTEDVKTTVEITNMAQSTTKATKEGNAEKTKDPADTVDFIMGVVSAVVSQFSHLMQSFSF